MPVKGGEIEVEGASLAAFGPALIHPDKENNMGGIGKKGEPAKKEEVKSKKPPPVPTEEDEVEDGDIATPKRDRNGNDDEPL